MKRNQPPWIVLGVLMLSSLATGCAGMQIQKYAHLPKDNDATIIVYRQFALNAVGVKAILELDGQNILGLGNKEYASVRVSPGTHRVAVRASTTPQKDLREVSLSENQTLYLRIEPNPNRFLSGLVPFADLVVKTFLFRESTAEEFASSAKDFDQISVEYGR